jgi:peptidoglycan hydrolase-like protein with peptidoglycan-binding domain
MATANQVLDIARGELGTEEVPWGSNKVKYSYWYPMPGYPWCAMFVSWVLDHAGIEGFKHASTPRGAELFRSAGRWTETPQPGDVVYFDFPDSEPRIQHVGFVEHVGDLITTIEGNTYMTHDDNEGKVMRRERPRSFIVGYGRPPYDGQGHVLGLSRIAKKTSFTLGDSGADVEMWQRQLNAVLEVDLNIDGDFGPATLEATKRFQREHDLEVDGEVGPRSLDKMDQVYRKLKRGEGGNPPTLEIYDKGRWVKKAQQRLSELGQDLGPDGIDGDFGPATAKAVKAFKKDHKLPGTAVVGPRVWKVLDL